ncbi:hypothetical protein CKF54_00860 [Psittacicella hinzii]|uniref:Uncharacterized protein n=1 Tax=Psittacicella hinzii TaxID=2028575 RepID=A0A3A1Y7P8_9GAMM|nr:tape measure protein [Psittacicella hinzii]RIY34323.1 hypothetical protein CKF54_00860 [Psittacicella hinzii]
MASSQQTFSFKLNFDTSSAISAAKAGSKALGQTKDTIDSFNSSADKVEKFSNSIEKGIGGLADLVNANKKSFDSIEQVSVKTNNLAGSFNSAVSSLGDYDTLINRVNERSLTFARSLDSIGKGLTSSSNAIKDVNALKELGNAKFKLPVTDTQVRKLVNLGEQMSGLNKSVTPTANSFAKLKNHLGTVTASVDAQRSSISKYLTTIKSFQSSVKDIKTISNDLKAIDKKIDNTRASAKKAREETSRLSNTVGKLNNNLDNATKDPLKITNDQVNKLHNVNEKLSTFTEKMPAFLQSLNEISKALPSVYEVQSKIIGELPKFLEIIKESGKLGSVLSSLASQINATNQNINNLSNSSNKAKKEVKELGTEVDNSTKDIEELKDKTNEASKELNNFGNVAGNVQGNFSGLFTKLAGLFAINFSFDQVKSSAVAYQDLTTKLTLIKDPAESTTTILNELFAVSSDARQPIEATTEAYVTLRKSTEGLGLKQKDLLGITTTLTKAIAIGGSSAEATKNSMVQFSQALSMGYLSGQNFNSVAEQTPGLIDAIARGMGMTTSQLKEYANSSKLTTEDIVHALQATATETDAIYSKVTVSVGSAITELKNKFTQFIGQNDFVSESLANVILSIANNFEGMLQVAKAGLAVFAGYKALQMIEYFKGLDKPTVGFIGSLKQVVTNLRSVTVESIKAKAALTAKAVATGIATTATTALGIAFKALDTLVKSTVIGAVMWGIVEAVKGVYTWITRSYDSYKKFADASRVHNLAEIENLDDRIARGEELIKNGQELIKTKQEQLEDAQEDLDNYKKLGVAARDLAEAAQQRVDALRAEITAQQQITAEMQAQVNEAKNLKAAQNNDKPQEVATKAPVVDKTATAVISKYQQNIDQLKGTISEANAKYQILLETGRTQMTQLDQVNAKILAGAEGYRNLTQSQIDNYRALAEQIDHINASTNAQRAMLENDQTIERLQFELSLKGLDQEIAEQRLLQREREIELKQMSMGLDYEEMEMLRQSYEERWELEDKLKAKTEDNTNLFVKSLQQAMPTIQDFQNTVTRGFGSVVDGMAQMVVTGQGSLRKLLSSFTKSIATMLVKAAIVSALLTTMNYIVPGSGQAIATAFNVAGQAAMQSGNTGMLGANPIGAIMGFSSGGYTGNVGTNKVAGVVHGQEYVLNAQATSKYGVDFLDKLNNQTLEFTSSSSKNSKSGSGSDQGFAQTINVYNYSSDVDAEVTRQENGDLDIYITNKVREEVANALVEREMR